MRARWGSTPEFFGPRHAHREVRIARRLRDAVPTPGLHLECAAGVGSLTLTLAREGRTVVAADLSMRSLINLRLQAAACGITGNALPVVADLSALPFRDDTFPAVTSAETLEHIPDHENAARELARVLAPGGWLIGTVPAGPSQWSDWDEWAGHLRRYTNREMRGMLKRTGLQPEVTVWGWPLLRLYDDLFLKRVNRRRLHLDGTIADDPTLRRISGLGRRRGLVALVRLLFDLDRIFDGVPWGVGLLFAARKPR